MCSKCDQINATMVRYRHLKVHVNDQQTTQALDVLLAKLEAEKQALHPKEQGRLD